MFFLLKINDSLLCIWQLEMGPLSLMTFLLCNVLMIVHRCSFVHSTGNTWHLQSVLSFNSKTLPHWLIKLNGILRRLVVIPVFQNRNLRRVKFLEKKKKFKNKACSESQVNSRSQKGFVPPSVTRVEVSMTHTGQDFCHTRPTWLTKKHWEFWLWSEFAPSS